MLSMNQFPMVNGSDRFLITVGFTSNLPIPFMRSVIGLLTPSFSSFDPCLFAVPIGVPPVLLNPMFSVL